MAIKNLIKNNLVLILLIVLIIPTFSFLLKPGMYWNMHDDMQPIRQLSFEKCLLDGQIPCRWSPDPGYGYGYPLFNFYPPMPYIVGQFFRFLSFDFITTIKLTAITQTILAAVFMYILASSIFGKLGGLLSALFYSYAPYHALNIYVRGAMNEAWAAVFFPLILYFSRRLILEKRHKHLVLLSLSLAGLLLSHNPMALTFLPIFAAWVLFWYLSTFKKINLNLIWQNKKPLIQIILSGLLAVALTSFYTIPVLLETKYVQIESMFSNYYHWSVHFTSLYQLFISSFWGDGASVWGQEDNMSFMVGYLHWLIPLVILVLSSFKLLKTKKIKLNLILPIFIGLMALFAAFMTHERSAFIWSMLPIIQKIQFPWRFLNHSAFLFSLSVAALPATLSYFIKSPKIKNGLITAVILGLIIVNKNYFIPLTSGPITDEQKLSGQSWVYQVTSGIYDYLPKTARVAPQSAAKEFIDDIKPKSEYELTGQKRGTDWLFFNIKLTQDSTLTLANLAYPGFTLYQNGQPIKYDIEPELGRITVNLPAGNHQLYLKLQNTPTRNIANTISLVAWGALLGLLLKKLWIKKKLI
jgi:hypothetical protein